MPIEVNRRPARSMLTPTGGFLEGYTHSLNPYGGCSFACSYCYVRQLPVALFRGKPWGTWVDIKEGAAERLAADLRKARRRGRVTIFMSSSTDPYQPVEARERLTRSLLEAMAAEPPDFLCVQTRSPLVLRDLDVLQRLQAASGGSLRVSLTVETDLEPIRRRFAPASPPLAARFRALRALREAGIPAQAAVAPLLPCSDGFAAKLAAHCDRVVLDDYFMGDGSGGRRTARLGIAALYEETGLGEWYSPEAHQRVLEQLRAAFPPGAVFVSQAGFLP